VQLANAELYLTITPGYNQLKTTGVPTSATRVPVKHLRTRSLTHRRHIVANPSRTEASPPPPHHPFTGTHSTVATASATTLRRRHHRRRLPAAKPLPPGCTLHMAPRRSPTLSPRDNKLEGHFPGDRWPTRVCLQAAASRGSRG